MGVDPAPVVVLPTKNFDGTDGQWSTFSLRVGNPPVSVRVFPSTFLPETWVVIKSGCGSQSVPNCEESRGGTFSNKSSSTWKDLGTWSIVELENIDVDPNAGGGQVGYDTVGIQAQGAEPLTLEHQVVLALARQDFWLGNLGLAARASAYDNGTQTSFLTSLRDQKKIPSLSYGYTAGASYRDNTLGSLTLGGYDVSRFTPNDLSINFAAAPERDLVVGIQSINYSDSDTPSTELLSDGIQSFIDSTLPHIWLPTDACDKVQKAFGLTWNAAQLRYTISDQQHDLNIKKNASVTFQIGATTSGGSSVNINLPYSSFDLELLPPQTDTPTKYFPLRQANRPDQYTLGRTFLQEAFLIVNYEYSNFSISQCDWSSNKPAHIIAIPSKDSANSGTLTGLDGSSTATGSSSSSTAVAGSADGSHGLQTSAIAGIAIGVLAIAILLPTIAILYICRKKRQKAKKEHLPVELPNVPKDDDYFSITPHGSKRDAPNSKHTVVGSRELDGTQIYTPTPGDIQPSDVLHGEPVELVGDLGTRAEMPSPEPQDHHSFSSGSRRSRTRSSATYEGLGHGGTYLEASSPSSSLSRGHMHIPMPRSDLNHRISHPYPGTPSVFPSPPGDNSSPTQGEPVSALQSPHINFARPVVGAPSNISSPDVEHHSFLDHSSSDGHSR